MAVDKVEFLKGVPLFSELPEAHLQSLGELLIERSYRRGATIFFEGDPGDALYIVRSGIVKISRVAEDGREKTLAFLGKGEPFGEMALIDGGPRSAIAQALEATSLYALHRADFLAALTENPALSLGVIKVLSARLQQANAQLMDLVFRDVRGRVAQALLDLARRHGVPLTNGRMISVKLTHQEIANLVGTARETVSRTFAELQDSGIIRIEGRNIVLLDAAQLEGYAAGF